LSDVAEVSPATSGIGGEFVVGLSRIQEVSMNLAIDVGFVVASVGLVALLPPTRALLIEALRHPRREACLDVRGSKARSDCRSQGGRGLEHEADCEPMHPAIDWAG
jgi:hypothetical protein